MAKVLSVEEADQIVGRQALIDERENEALKQLAAMSFRVSVYEAPRVVEGDELLGTESRIVPGNVYAILYSVDGKRKSIGSSSAVDALAQARSWFSGQSRLKREHRFQVSAEPVPVHVVQQAAGDKATTELRRLGTRRREISWQSGQAEEIVDAP